MEKGTQYKMEEKQDFSEKSAPWNTISSTVQDKTKVVDKH